MELTGADIVRHPLVRRIVAAYDSDRPERSNGPRNRADRLASQARSEPNGTAVNETLPESNPEPLQESGGDQVVT